MCACGAAFGALSGDDIRAGGMLIHGPYATIGGHVESPEVHLNYLLNQATAASRRHLAAHLREVGLSQLEWPLLRHALRDENEGKVTTEAHVIQRTEMDDITFRHTLDGLVARGLMTVGGPEEAVHLTDAGRRLAEPLVVAVESIATRATSGFTAEDIRLFSDYVLRFQGNLDG